MPFIRLTNTIMSNMAKMWAMIIGIVFIVIGVIGYIPGGLGIVGPTGFFTTNHLHDIIHLLSGLVILLVALASPASSSAVLKVFGYVYLLVTLLGFVAFSFMQSIILLNGADNYLHLILIIVILWAAYGTGKSMATASV